jgi:hypothetical protein
MQESKPQEQKKDEPLEKLFNQIKVKFAEDESVTFEMKTGEYDTGSLDVWFEKQIGENYVDRDIMENVARKIVKIVESNQFEARMRGAGNWLLSIRIDPKFFDGKINWRRWPPNYNAFSDASQKLLDEVALTYPELSKIIDEGHSHDEYGRFNHFLRMAPLNKKEREVVEREMSVAFI